MIEVLDNILKSVQSSSKNGSRPYLGKVISYCLEKTIYKESGQEKKMPGKYLEICSPFTRERI